MKSWRPDILQFSTMVIHLVWDIIPISLLPFELKVNFCILEIRVQGLPKTETHEQTCILAHKVPGNRNTYVFYGNNAGMGSTAMDSAPSSATKWLWELVQIPSHLCVSGFK